MLLTFGSILIDWLAILVTVAAGVVVFFKWKFSYWEKKGVQVLPPSMFYGNSKEFFTGKCTRGEYSVKEYKIFKARGLKFAGGYMFANPYFVPIDPEIVKHIMQLDFDHFVNHGNYTNVKDDPLGGHLFNMENTEWKNMRVKLTPTFTSGKMKMMFPTLVDTARGLKDVMDVAEKSKTPIEIKETLARFTTDIIGSCAFGIECNSLKDSEAEFRKYGKKLFESTPGFRFKMMMFMALPHDLLRKLHVTFTKKEIEAFFMDAVKKTVNYREQNNIYRKDFMHLLLQLKNRGKVTDDEEVVEKSSQPKEKAMTIEELAAQCFVFFVAGFETSSTTMTFALYELARNRDVQDKLRQEIEEVLARHNGEITYDGLMEMTYMDKVLKETLRMYPALPLLQRVCTKDYIIPGTDITIEKGTRVFIPVMGIQRDPEYYENPDVFDPEHFSDDLKNTRHQYTWFPFGEGPRLCIGMRFGLMQSKVGLATLLRNYNITLNKKTKNPMTIDKRSFIPQIDGGLWIDVTETKPKTS